jgi:hypothetical protein
VQYRPTAAELLDAVAQLLEDEILGAVAGPLQHRVRVAAHLTRMVQREFTHAAPADTDERERLAQILAEPEADLPTLRAHLAERLADPEPIGPALNRGIYTALLATAHADLAICKPGYDRWTAEP